MAVLVHFGHLVYLHSRYVWNGNERMILTWSRRENMHDLYRRHNEDLLIVAELLENCVEGAVHDSWTEKNN